MWYGSGPVKCASESGAAHAWAIMGMNMFPGLRFALWEGRGDAAAIAATANDLIVSGIRRAADLRPG
jgi:hypothetical protein